MRAQALKNGDGSYTVRVFSAFDKSTDVLFPMNDETERLALEYAEFKNSQAVTGPDSPATQAVLADFKAMQSNDRHEQLMAAAQLTPEEQEINAISPRTIVAEREDYSERSSGPGARGEER